jgi:hypothetical protein
MRRGTIAGCAGADRFGQSTGGTLAASSSAFLGWRSTMSPGDKFRITAGVDQRSSILKQEASESGPDAVLVALGLKFEALSSELEALQNEQVDTSAAVVQRGDQVNGEGTISPLDQRIEAVLTLLYPIERAIMATPAMTIVGLGVKARHAAQVLSHYWTHSPERLDWDARAVRLLIESTCTVAGVELLSS